MKSLTKALAGVALAMAFAAAPVAANAPYEDQGFYQYVNENPCTGLAYTTYFDVTYLVHEHESNLVLTTLPHRSSAWTSDGYTEVSGNETIVVNKGGVSNPATTLFRHPDGSMIKYRQMFVWNENTQKVVIARAELTCLGPQG
jgi:hypothetical protein